MFRRSVISDCRKPCAVVEARDLRHQTQLVDARHRSASPAVTAGACALNGVGPAGIARVSRSTRRLMRRLEAIDRAGQARQRVERRPDPDRQAREPRGAAAPTGRRTRCGRPDSRACRPGTASACRCGWRRRRPGARRRVGDVSRPHRVEDVAHLIGNRLDASRARRAPRSCRA